MKENFLLNTSLLSTVESLSDDDAGKLFKGILKYTNNLNNDLNGLLYTVFIPIKESIDKNNKKYLKKCEILKSNTGKTEVNTKSTRNRTDIDTKSCRNSNEISSDASYTYSYNNNHNTLDIIKNIINYLNNKINSNYKYKSKITQDKIKARLNEGYKLDDFIAVIDKKYEEWNGTDMQIYLRPETLFGTKFESYLNQNNKPIANKKQQRPDWYNKKIDDAPLEGKEKEELERMLGEFK